MALISKAEALWVSFLRQKYKILSYLPDSITHASCTPLWRSLAHIWDEFRSNISWCVSDGSLVDVWQDIWVPSVGRLCDQVLDSTAPLRYLTFLDFMTPSGSWNLSLLSSIFPVSVAHRILSIRCLSPDGVSNFCRWRWDDWFTISSAYAKCVEHALPPCSNTWNINGSAVILVIPLHVHGVVLANRFFMSYGIAQRRGIFSLPSSGVCYLLIFMLIVWIIGFAAPINSTASRVIAWSQHYSVVSATAHAQHTVRSVAASSWSTPSPPWFCLNTNGSVCSRSNYARSDDVIRDSNGAWIAGFGRGIGIADAFTAELWAIYDGLLLAWQLGLDLVQVQSDCSKAISALSNANAQHGHPTLLWTIHSLCQ
ncbi:hypothetical protein V6N11_035431 [Hibiscus sabdariffa]|uniref:RNase H type-1 domain-containing protein n=1 Tax=Hibiscus sabdariffa TaxID=183260 RepID=A0ABR2R0E5_9ROSI